MDDMKQRGIWIYCLLIAALVSLHRRDDRGATTVEYGLIAALCVLAMVGGVAAIRAALAAFYAGQQETVDGWVPAG